MACGRGAKGRGKGREGGGAIQGENATESSRTLDLNSKRQNTRIVLKILLDALTSSLQAAGAPIMDGLTLGTLDDRQLGRVYDVLCLELALPPLL